jgi:hypothetical protein
MTREEFYGYDVNKENIREKLITKFKNYYEEAEVNSYKISIEKYNNFFCKLYNGNIELKDKEGSILLSYNPNLIATIMMKIGLRNRLFKKKEKETMLKSLRDYVNITNSELYKNMDKIYIYNKDLIIKRRKKKCK